MPQTLLINSSYQAIAFIEERSCIRLVFNGKVDILSEWDKDITWINGSIKYPAVIKLKHYTKSIHRIMKFCRLNIFKRDNWVCAYCLTELTGNNATVDHIISSYNGGKNSWENCISCCKTCNLKKGNKNLLESGMKLLYTPAKPISSIKNDYNNILEKHEDWKNYI